MTYRITLVCLLAIVALQPSVARAEHTRFGRESDSASFTKGTANGVAIQSDGMLRPAPRFTSFADPNLAYLWALRTDSAGRLYAAGGSNAKVLRFDSAGKATPVFDSGELTAQTIAFDAKDNLYVGTSPDGKVYKVTADGQKTVFFDPQTKYIWAIAFDPQGNLFVATGDKGQVFVVPPSGKGQVFYQSDERHARSLAFDAKGNLLIGTEPDGLILRIDIDRKNANAPPQAGSAFVIYETDKKEVTSLLADAAGNIYAASVGDKVRAPALAPLVPNVVSSQTVTVTATLEPGGDAGLQASPLIQQQPGNFAPNYVPPAGGTQVVKIAPDGSPEALWTSRDQLVYAMGLSRDGRPLLGTGDKGTIIELEGAGVYASIAKTASAQVTSLVAGPEGKIFVATANPGKIFTLGPGYEPGGSFESNTFDAKIFSHWGRLTWWGENGAAQGKVAFYARSGNTSSPEKNWSAWAGPYKSAGGDEVTCPPARFIQWKAVFLDVDKGAAPNISWVSVAYQPKNVAPVIDDIAIQDPGLRAVSFASIGNGTGASAPVPLRIPQRAATASATQVVSTGSDTNPKSTHADVFPQGVADKGYQTALWAAHDDNDDDLTFAIYYRSEGEQNWRLLKDKVADSYISWDTTTLPDGAYYLKVVASDSPSNPTDQSLSGERLSDRFEVSNTPPRIENLRADANAAPAKVTFDGISPSGALGRAVYSVDGGDWQIVFPTGLLSDSAKEAYQIQLAGLSAGQHTVAVQVSDRFGNTTVEKTKVSVASRTAK
jgi:WD40 repeat protein